MVRRLVRRSTPPLRARSVRLRERQGACSPQHHYRFGTQERHRRRLKVCRHKEFFHRTRQGRSRLTDICHQVVIYRKGFKVQRSLFLQQDICIQRSPEAGPDGIPLQFGSYRRNLLHSKEFLRKEHRFIQPFNCCGNHLQQALDIFQIQRRQQFVGQFLLQVQRR